MSVSRGSRPQGVIGTSAVSVGTGKYVAMISRLGLVVAGIYILATSSGGDAHAYWSASGYAAVADQRDAFLYSPTFLQALWPLQQLPWEVFRFVWLAAGLIALDWMVGPTVALLVLLPMGFSPVYTDLYYGNIMVFTAALAVAGFRHPAWWAVLPFTKLLPGVALLWSWRAALIAALVAAASFLLAPSLWLDWLGVLRASADAPPTNGLAGWLIPRAMVAVALVVVGRWQGWRWTVPTTVLLCQPVLWFSSFTILLGWVWILRRPANPEGRRASRPHATRTLAAQTVPADG